MEPLLTLLLSAAATFGTAAVGQVAESAVGDAWAAVKNAITRRRPDAAEAPKLIEELRAAPGSPNAQQAVQRLEQLDITRDVEVANAIRSLIAALQSAGGGATVNAPKAENVYGSQISYGGSNTFNFGKPE